MQRQQWIMQAAFVGLAAGVISTGALVAVGLMAKWRYLRARYPAPANKTAAQPSAADVRRQKATGAGLPHRQVAKARPRV